MAARCSWYDLTLTNKCTATTTGFCASALAHHGNMPRESHAVLLLKESLRPAVYGSLMHFEAALHIFSRIALKWLFSVQTYCFYTTFSSSPIAHYVSYIARHPSFFFSSHHPSYVLPLSISQLIFITLFFFPLPILVSLYVFLSLVLAGSADFMRCLHSWSSTADLRSTFKLFSKSFGHYMTKTTSDQEP